MGITVHLICLLRNLYAGQETTVRTRHGTTTGLKLGRVSVKTVYCHSVQLTYMQSTSYKMLGWMNHRLEARLLGKIPTISDVDDTTLISESEEELKSLLMKVKDLSEEAGLKFIIQKSKIMASGSITSWQIGGGKKWK